MRKNDEYAACGALRFAIDKGSRRPEVEHIILKYPQYAAEYAYSLMKGRWPEAEDIIKQNATASLYYSRTVLKARWLEAEDIIKTNAEAAADYAIYIIGDRWLEAEDTIKTNADAAFKYIKGILKAPWPDAEATILNSRNSTHIIEYASDYLKRRWPEAELMMKDILKKEGTTHLHRALFLMTEYAFNVIKGPWADVEEILASDRYKERGKGYFDYLAEYEARMGGITGKGKQANSTVLQRVSEFDADKEVFDGIGRRKKEK